MIKKTIYSIMLLCALCACSSNDDDMEKPVISDQGITANPIDCQQYHSGDVIPFHYMMSDDQELGNFNIEVHNNFDHHTHSTSIIECPMDEKKEPVKAWVYNKDFEIPAGLQKYEARVDIQIPSDIDTGDYHFSIRLTDHAGWQQIHAVTIKIVE